MLASGAYRVAFTPNSAPYQLHVENNGTGIMGRIATALHKYPPVEQLLGLQVSFTLCASTEQRHFVGNKPIARQRDYYCASRLHPSSQCRMRLKSTNTHLQVYYGSNCALMWARITDPPYRSAQGFYFRRSQELKSVKKALEMSKIELADFYENVHTLRSERER